MTERSAAFTPLPLSELREALAASRIKPLYQPIVSIRQRNVAAIEVLARLAHPMRGTVAPDLFVPQIENAGLALRLTQVVGHSAFMDWGGGRLEQLGVCLALNFPLDVLLMPAALAWLEQAREVARIPAARVTIELTESRPVAKVSELGTVVSRLRRQGYQLAIDDVGPDQRDCRDLLALEFSLLKLDKGVVLEAMGCARAEEFLIRTATLAHAAGMRVVAEGVATAEMWAKMGELSVDEAQGFFIAEPIPSDTVPLWHREWVSRGALPAPAG
jgi:EAL domain-containing protein (putative c-di-GMP-specific phosphodiesterase class I)